MILLVAILAQKGRETNPQWTGRLLRTKKRQAPRKRQRTGGAALRPGPALELGATLANRYWEDMRPGPSSRTIVRRDQSEQRQLEAAQRQQAGIC
eukprot:1143510-Pelagomonas_calceolata.AAC.2